MRFEVVHQHAVALGVDWYGLPEAESEKKKYLTTLKKSSRATHTLILNLEDRLYYGVTSVKGQRKVPKKFASALAWFAMTRPLGQGLEAIVWVQGDIARASDISAMRAWVGGVVDGAPMDRCDRMVRLTDVSATLMEMYGDRHSEVKVYVCGFPEHSFGIFGEYHQNFASLSETHIEDLFPPECPPDALMKPTGLSPTAVKAVVASFTVLVAGTAGAGYMHYLEVQEQERLAEEARLRALAAAQPKPEDVYAQAFATYFTTGFKRIAAADAARTAFTAFRKVRMADKGWEFSEFICATRTLPGSTGAPNTIADPLCQIEYRRKPESAPLPISADDYLAIDKQVEMVRARKVFDATLITLDPKTKPADLLARLAPVIAIDGLLKPLRQAKDHGVKVYFQAPNKLPPESNKLPPAPNNGTNFEVRTGAWSMTGPMELYEMLYTLPPTAFIHSIRVYEDKRTLQFKAEGYYYVADLIPKKSTPLPAPAPMVQQAATPVAPPATPAQGTPAGTAMPANNDGIAIAAKPVRSESAPELKGNAQVVPTTAGPGSTPPGLPASEAAQAPRLTTPFNTAK
ncbi:hypothetical protein [Noviherbaspirillum malthae]|uniref:hypothetical protein n=1 Tax=Noviherbaspirillum malthae TaxID=1260987 RepID=UPI00188F45D6|nr:hypothetical protein [Noviherbaspirillum malthae]